MNLSPIKKHNYLYHINYAASCFILGSFSHLIYLVLLPYDYTVLRFLFSIPLLLSFISCFFTGVLTTIGTLLTENGCEPPVWIHLLQNSFFSNFSFLLILLYNNLNILALVITDTKKLSVTLCYLFLQLLTYLPYCLCAHLAGSESLTVDRSEHNDNFVGSEVFWVILKLVFLGVWITFILVLSLTSIISQYNQNLAFSLLAGLSCLINVYFIFLIKNYNIKLFKLGSVSVGLIILTLIAATIVNVVYVIQASQLTKTATILTFNYWYLALYTFGLTLAPLNIFVNHLLETTHDTLEAFIFSSITLLIYFSLMFLNLLTYN